MPDALEPHLAFDDRGQGSCGAAQRIRRDDTHSTHANEHVQSAGDRQRQQQRSRHGRSCVARLFGQRGDVVEPDEGEEHEGGTGQDAACRGALEERTVADMRRARDDHDDESTDLQRREPDREPDRSLDAGRDDRGQGEEQPYRGKPLVNRYEVLEIVGESERHSGSGHDVRDGHHPARQVSNKRIEGTRRPLVLHARAREHAGQLAVCERRQAGQDRCDRERQPQRRPRLPCGFAHEHIDAGADDDANARCRQLPEPERASQTVWWFVSRRRGHARLLSLDSHPATEVPYL